MTSPFAGRPVDLSAPGVLWRGDFRRVDEIPLPVRHASGWEPFAERVRAAGEDPTALAADAGLLFEHLQRRRDDLRAGGDVLLDSAGVFLGNTLIARVHDAAWQALAPGRPEVGQPEGAAVEPFAVVRLIAESDVDHASEFDDLLRGWDGHHEAQRAREAAERRAHQRLVLRTDPVLPTTPFVREQGAHLVALLDDLVQYLTTQYHASAVDTDPAPDDPRTISPTVRTIRVSPAATDGAPLVIAVDSVGALAVRAGVLHDFFFFGPDAAALEDTLLAVAAGLYRETHAITPDDISGYRLGSVHGPERFQTGDSDVLDPDRLTAAAARLDALPDGWAPWPLRHP